MGSIQFSHVEWKLPSGEELLRDVSFRVPDGERVALVGANGAGKSTVVRLAIGELTATSGTISVNGHLGVMRQLVGTLGTHDTNDGGEHDAGDGGTHGGGARGGTHDTGDGRQAPATVRDLLVSLAPPTLGDMARRIDAAATRMATDPMPYATALADWGDLGGYDLEVLWDECTGRALGADLSEVAARPLTTLSGGEQKRLALEVLLRGDAEILVLDEPDNFLDVPAKRWLERELNASRKTVLYVSHDRELLAATATKVVTIDAGESWTHGGGFATYAEARRHHLELRTKDLALYDDERRRLEDLVAEMRRRAAISEIFAPKLKAAESRLRQFTQRTERPAEIREQTIDVRLRGARTGKRAVIAERLELLGLTDAFDLEIWYGERVAVLGGNGAGKSHLLRLLDGDASVQHSGSVRLGAGVVPGLFNQTHDHPEWARRTLVEILHDHDVVLGPAMGMLRRYELQPHAQQYFDTLSGGQQARFQILLLELSGCTLLLLDEPTDNLDLVSAEALEVGLERFDGTVIAVTHDRWFLRGFDRFVVFGEDCTVTDHAECPAAWR